MYRDAPQAQLTQIRIWQQNLNTSHIALHSLTNDRIADNWDVVALQEPPIDKLGNTKANFRWRVVYPTHKLAKGEKPRAVFFVNTKISTNCWEQVDFPSADVVILRIRTANGMCTIANIYNDCTHDRTLEELSRFLVTGIAKLCPEERDHMVWLGDFNRHHPLWDEERNNHLFTTAALALSQKILDLLADYGMTQTLPKDTPTLQASSTGNWTRPDNVFCTEHTSEYLALCNTDPDNRGPNTDHLLILTKLDLAVSATPSLPTLNYREVDWKKFNNKLKAELSQIGPSRLLATREEFQEAARGLEGALRNTVAEEVPKTRPHPHNKRWWTKDLTKLRNDLKVLSKASHSFRAVPDHPSHRMRKEKVAKYDKAIRTTKKDHWINWLEDAMGNDLWITNKYITNPAGDGGKTRIPTLITKDNEGNATMATSNESKSEVFTKTLFPPPPSRSAVPPDFEYPEPATPWSDITGEQLRKTIVKLSPYKAPSPDGVANIVFQHCPVLQPYLLSLFNAALSLRTYYNPWRESITVILRKPGRPDYSVPKAYRPIALLNTTAKLVSAIVTDRASHILETHRLLPATHFGSRPGHSTEDSLLLLETTIKHAWRQHKVASVLFLDIEGAFPNAVTDQLLHNMKKRGLPLEIVGFTERLLDNRKTKLRFDDYESEWFPLRNGIGQGDPLSMLLYVIYSSDLVDTARKENRELALAFVDDTALVVVGKSIVEMHQKLKDMLKQQGGGYEWSANHNSRFETNKFALMDFSLNRAKPRPDMNLQGVTIKSAPSHKFLGVIIDNELRWTAQAAYATAKGAKYTILLRRLSATLWGVPAKLIRQLYLSVVIPKITYAAAVWLQPSFAHPSDKRLRGSKGIARKIGSTQRTAALAITGAMRTTPTDSLNVHANLLPTHLMFQQVLFRSALRLSSLPDAHPLKPHIKRIEKKDVKRHRSALHKLIHTLGVHPECNETILPHAVKPGTHPPFKTCIADNKEASLKDFGKLGDRTLVFTDGSCTDGLIGASAVLYVDHTHVATLRYHLGSAEHHTVFEAEAAGLILAARLLIMRPETSFLASILVDNQAVIRSGERPTAKPGHYLLLRFRNLMRQLHEEKDSSREDVTVRWIAGHKEVEGNEVADREAKLVVKGEAKSSPKHKLPNALWKRLPCSIPALKQSHNAKLKKIWNDKWSKSPHFPPPLAPDLRCSHALQMGFLCYEKPICETPSLGVIPPKFPI